MALIFHVISLNCLSQEPCDFLGRSAARSVSILPSLVAIGTTVVKT